MSGKCFALSGHRMDSMLRWISVKEFWGKCPVITQPPQSGALASCGVEAAAVKLDTAKSSGTEWSKARTRPAGSPVRETS